MKLRTIVVSAAYFALIVTSQKRLAWQPADGPLKTRWTREVTPENAWSEYPRPQMVRKEWTNLNGLWQYAIRPAAEERPGKWDGEILVPFAVESALSGVKKPVKPDERLWYRRTVLLPALGKEKRMLLHFGAVDWKCMVWVNDKKVGEHTGGYDPFTFDITDALKDGDNEIVVAVSDPTDTGTQPRGKQVLTPHGIFYTAVTGIWQTVWLEPVSKRHVESLKFAPDVDHGMIVVTVNASAGGDYRARVVDRDDQNMYAEIRGGQRSSFQLDFAVPGSQKLWSPDHPFLYDFEIELIENGRVVDKVTSYFGMRKIEVKKDADGINRLWLNNKVLFQYGPLDQGWWPDGLYTPPGDAAMQYDIEMTKKFGMNMIRKHVKVEPDRWYYLCDKLGVLVWQDMVSGDAQKTAASKANYLKELKAMIGTLANHPSIVMWVPFNEGWGQHDTPEVVDFVKKLDPTRPVNEASGWTDMHSGDVSDMHSYPGPGMRDPENDRVCVLGEFGGLGMPVRGHTWQQEKNWGYVTYDTPEKLTDAYVDLLTAMRPLIGRGLSAAVYTQTTDVEIEVNGLMTYDREVVKMDQSRIKEAAAQLYAPAPKITTLVPTSEKSAQTWRYTTGDPGKNWPKPEFADGDWKTGPGGFGTEGTPSAVVRTKWNTPDICLRRRFELKEQPKEGQIALNIHHDDDAEVYLNGQLVRTFQRHTRNYQIALLPAGLRTLLKKGTNTLAVHCHQSGGGQFIDVGLVQILEP